MMETKIYKLKISSFLNWYFADNDDYKFIGQRVESLLKSSEVAKISLQDLFDEQNELPTWILEAYEGEEDYIESQYVKLVKN